MNYSTKNFETATKAIDDNERIVEGYFSAFGNIDSDNDVMEKGAFKKSISERGPAAKNQIKFLAYHDISKPLGPILKLEEDDFGLKYTAKISKTSYGNDVYELIKDGSITEQSVGFQTIKQKKDKDGVNRITEVKMWEGSLVVWGANQATPLTSVKSMGELYDELEFLNKQIRKGEIDDLTLLSLKLEQLKQAIEDLTPIDEQSTEEVTEPLENRPSEELELLKLFKENLTFLQK